eukprot:scaffold5915_cov128-Isochrysis_galbana.AAC.3
MSSPGSDSQSLMPSEDFPTAVGPASTTTRRLADAAVPESGMAVLAAEEIVTTNQCKLISTQGPRAASQGLPRLGRALIRLGLRSQEP